MTSLGPTSDDYELVKETYSYSDQIVLTDTLSLALMAGGAILEQNARDEGKRTKFGEGLNTTGFCPICSPQRLFTRFRATANVRGDHLDCGLGCLS